MPWWLCWLWFLWWLRTLRSHEMSNDNFWWQFLMTIFDDNFWWQFLMTICDDNFWWQFLITISDGNGNDDMIHDIMIHDTWYMIHDTWYMTHDTWHMTHDTWHMTHDTWYMIHDTCRSNPWPNECLPRMKCTPQHCRTQRWSYHGTFSVPRRGSNLGHLGWQPSTLITRLSETS